MTLLKPGFKIEKLLGIRGLLLGGLSAGVAAQSPSRLSPGVVAQLPAKRLKQEGQI